MKYFKTKGGQIPLPVFFPDATRAVIKSLDSKDIESTKTPGILVNTYHLYKDVGEKIIKDFGGIRKFMNWNGTVISDSGGFQIMTLAKKPGKNGKINNNGVTFFDESGKKTLFTPEDSIRFQALLKTDMFVVLDDFTPPKADYRVAKETVERTILWAEKSKKEFLKLTKGQKSVPYLLGVIQGGDYKDLRKECIDRLVEIGFDGLGFGGWAIKDDGALDLELSSFIAQNTPKNYLLYGLGIGKPEDIVECCKMGYQIFDCVLPTRDARHNRLYIYNSESIEKISLKSKDFYLYYNPSKAENLKDNGHISKACDCLLCKNYTRAYLAHLFRINEATAMRLATIHNLRFYSILLEKLRKIKT